VAEDACNISGPERTKRWVVGTVGLAAGIALAAALVTFQAPWWSRVLLFVPFWIAGLGFFQARERVCVALAAKDKRNFGAGEQLIADSGLTYAIRRKARRIHISTVIFACLLTAGTFLFR
jgi:hypothetical protein